jgi:hypothetical protein
MFEKASLGANSRNLIQRRLSLQRIQSEDSTVFAIDLQSLKDRLNIAENEVKTSRKALRNWYRLHKSFATETCPELFHFLPDLRTPGSILGDGGFAGNANVNKKSKIIFFLNFLFRCLDDDSMNMMIFLL